MAMMAMMTMFAMVSSPVSFSMVRSFSISTVTSFAPASVLAGPPFFIFRGDFLLLGDFIVLSLGANFLDFLLDGNLFSDFLRFVILGGFPGHDLLNFFS